MRADFYPLQILLFTISGWVNRRQQDMIAYLVEENRILKEKLKGRKLSLTDNQRLVRRSTLLPTAVFDCGSVLPRLLPPTWKAARWEAP